MSIQSSRPFERTASPSINSDPVPERSLFIWIGCLYIGLAIFIMGWRFLYKDDLYYAFFADDYFYYAKIARNTANGFVSSFDTIHMTNGYHPLWMLMLTGLAVVFGNDLQLTIFVCTSIVIMCVIAFYFYFRIAQKLCGNEVVASALALYTGLFMLAISRTGMEVAITLLFDAVFIWRFLNLRLLKQTNGEALVTGFLASLIFLSRIDAVIFPAMLIAADLLLDRGHWRTLAKKLVFVALGAFLIPLYFLVNYWAFGVVLPISGMAKQLRSGFIPALNVLGRFFGPDPFNVPFLWPVFIASLATCAIWILGRRSRVARGDRGFWLAFCAIIYPWLYFVLITSRSDWPIWTWYLYPFVVTSSIVTPYLVQRFPACLGPGWIRSGLAALSMVVAVVLAVGLTRPNVTQFEIYAAGKKIAEYSANHPGVMAMGDRAGFPAFALEAPLIQLEGLVEDLPMLENIRGQRNLKDVLREENVKYYVATDPDERDGCLSVEEPARAGPRSPRMRGLFCEKPVDDFMVGPHRTVIFAVK